MKWGICHCVTKSVLYRSPWTVIISACDTIKTNTQCLGKKQQKYFTTSVMSMMMPLGQNVFTSLDLTEVIVTVFDISYDGIQILIIFFSSSKEYIVHS